MIDRELDFIGGETIMKLMFDRIGSWTLQRIKKLPEKDNAYTAWLIFTLFLATTGTGIIEILGNPLGASGFSHLLGIGMVVGINILLFPLVTVLLGIVFSFIYLPLPRLLLGSLSYAIFTSVYFLYIENSGTLFSFIIGIGYTLAALLLGAFFIVLYHKKIGRTAKLVTLGIALSLVSVYLFIVKVDYEPNSIPAIGEYSEPLLVENPGKPGDYDYRFLTYGSGEDIQRKEYGEDVDELTASVDSSHFITKWGKKRQKFWGFGPKNLPVNGRAFLPEGEGKFPVFLMVHGNHTMEYFSTAGYDYLGELLASRGIIAISVDEDFINYSNRLGIPNDNYQLRTWMMLQHLGALQELNANPNSAFFEKIDFDNVALMGHSRGGQAVAMAVDYQTYFDEEALDNIMEDVTIKGVVAISPTDKKVGDAKAKMHNVSYLALHGARDADVSNFRGDHQFYRTTFDPNDAGFKSTLYLAEANHTQFNSEWGKMDLSLPRGLFLNRQQTMDAENQQMVAKVYLSAFLETVFHGETGYEKLFEDYRNGSDWLPETPLVSKYEHASYQPIVTFDRNNIELMDEEGFSQWEVTTPKDRSNNNHPVDALKLEWETDAWYSVDLENKKLQARTGADADHFVFRMANIDSEMSEWREPEIDVELETVEGVTVRLPLSDFMPVPDVITTDYTPFGLFEKLFRDGKYDTSWEPTFQTIEVPIGAFEEASTDFARQDIAKLTLHFKSGGGKVFLEEIGVW